MVDFVCNMDAVKHLIVLLLLQSRQHKKGGKMMNAKHAVPALTMLTMVAMAATTVQAGMYAGGFGGMTVVQEWNLDKDSTSNYSGFSYHTNFDNDLDEGYTIGGFFGYQFATIPMRVETELSYFRNELDDYNYSATYADGSHYTGSRHRVDAALETTPFLVNAYVDFRNPSRVTPYLTAGVGFAHICFDTGDYDDDESDTVFAWQVGAGAAFQINNHLSVDVKYRYFNTEDMSYNNHYRDGSWYQNVHFDGNYASHSILAGVRYNF